MHDHALGCRFAPKHPTVSVIIPLYQTQKYIAATLESVLAQTFADFEVLVVDDGSRDDGPRIAAATGDARVRVITQANRGLAGARNTGIRHARGRYIALLDADDLWMPEKLARHVAHLDANPTVGVSFCASRLIDDDGVDIGLIQSPAEQSAFDAASMFCRNPVGNGSAPVLRRETLDAIAFFDPRYDAPTGRLSWFDESFRQSEDVECWTRIAATTPWLFGYIHDPLTHYRICSTGLSANLDAQFDSWRRFRAKVATFAPALEKAQGARAQGYQQRYLARRAVRSGDGAAARRLILGALGSYPRMLIEEPGRTGFTILGSILRTLVTEATFERLKQWAFAAKTRLPALRF